MIKFAKFFLGVVIIFILSWYLYSHWADLNYLLKLCFYDIIAIYSITILGTLITSYIVHSLLKTFQIKTRFWDIVLLQNATNLLNYVPMRYGTVFRANYLKRNYGLKYTQFGAFFIYSMLIMTAASAGAGIFAMVFVCDLRCHETQVLIVIFFLALLASLIFAFVPLPIPPRTRKIGVIISNFLTARRQVSTHKRVLLKCSILFIVLLVLSSARLGIIYHSMGQDIHWAGYVVLGALGQIIFFLSITPGSLGIREIAISSGGLALNIPLKVGVLASLMDRAVILSWIFSVGSICAVYLWHKSPMDFRTPNKTEDK